MKPADIEKAASLLLTARRHRHPMAALPPDLRPATEAASYLIQDAVSRGLGAIGGWKVGPGGPGVPHPRCAPIPKSLLLPTPATLPATQFTMLGIEAEIAFLIGRDLPARGRPYTRDDIVAAISAAHAGIELVDSRFKDRTAVDPLSGLADSISNGAYVLGSGTGNWHGLPLAQQTVRLSFDGKVVAETDKGNPAGDVIGFALWLANHLTERTGGLRAGDVVTTGSCTGLIETRPGTVVRAELPGIGEVSLTLSA